MCHSDESRPPAPPRQVDVGQHGDLRLTAADGNSLLAYEAHPAQPSGRGIVILPDIRGLHEYYKQLALRFAEAGFHAVAFDYFGRTAQDDDRSEGFDWQAHIPLTTPETVSLDVAAGVAHLRTAGVASVFTVGFCFGGRNSFRQAADQPGLAGAIGFYGSVDAVAPVAEQVQAPILMLLAGEDQSIRPESFDGLIEQLAARGIEVERQVYGGAPHSFFDRSFADHAEACADAWERILAFAARHAR
jgi:carboxymethylenebutenolidase